MLIMNSFGRCWRKRVYVCYCSRLRKQLTEKHKGAADAVLTLGCVPRSFVMLQHCALGVGPAHRRRRVLMDPARYRDD